MTKITFATVFLLSSISTLFLRVCDATPMLLQNDEDRANRPTLDEYRNGFRLGDNTNTDLQPEDTESYDEWTKPNGVQKNPGTLTWGDATVRNPARENYNPFDDRNEYFKVSTRNGNPQSAFRQRDGGNNRAAFLLDGLRKKAIRFSAYPQKKRQISYRHCFFNPISCF